MLVIGDLDSSCYKGVVRSARLIGVGLIHNWRRAETGDYRQLLLRIFALKDGIGWQPGGRMHGPKRGLLFFKIGDIMIWLKADRWD